MLLVLTVLHLIPVYAREGSGLRWHVVAFQGLLGPGGGPLSGKALAYIAFSDKLRVDLTEPFNVDVLLV